MKTSQSIQLLDTNDTNISPIVGVESIFYEQAENNKRKTLSDKLLLSGKDGSLSINNISYDDASNKNIVVNLSTSKLDGVDGSLFKLDVTQVSMSDFMGVIEEMIEEGGGGGGGKNYDASIHVLDNSVNILENSIDTFDASIEELSESYDELNTSFGILDTSVDKLWDSSKHLDTSVGKLWDSSKHNDASVKALWDSSMSGGGNTSINDIKIQDWFTPSHSIVNQTTKIADISIKTINNQSLIGLGNITISGGGGDASIYDIRVGDTQQSVVDANKIARIYRRDFITDASVDAWNNGGLISGTSQLGTINNTPFIYGQNVNVSADEVQDVKYGSRAQVYYKYTQSGSTTYKNIPEGTILIKPVYFEPSFWGILSIFSDGSGRLKYKDGNTEINTTEISLSEPILIIGKNSTVYNSSALSDDCYLNKSSINLSNAYSEFFNTNNEFKPYRTIYLCGSVTTTYGTQNAIFQLNKTPIITTEIDVLDLDKYYIPIGYSYDETQVPHASGEPYSSLTSKMHFYGGIPRIYKYNDQIGRLEEHHVNEGGSFDPVDINSSITEVSTRLDNVSTRLNSSVTNINSSISDISTRLDNVSTRLNSSVTNINSSILNIKTIDIRQDSSIQELWDNTGGILTQLKANHIYFGDDFITGGIANLPVACTVPTVIPSQQSGYSQFWMSGANKFYLYYPIYCLGSNSVYDATTDDIYIYKNNVDFSNSNVSSVTENITSIDVGKELYIMGHADGSIFYFDSNPGGTITQQTIFTASPDSSNYQYIPIGHIIDTSGGKPIINFVGGYVNDRIFDYNSQFGLIPTGSTLDLFNKTRQDIITADDVSSFFSSLTSDPNHIKISSHIVDINLTADGPAATGARSPRNIYFDKKLFTDYVYNILTTYPDAEVILRFWFPSVSGPTTQVNIQINDGGTGGNRFIYSNLLKTTSGSSPLRYMYVAKDYMGELKISIHKQPDNTITYGSNRDWYVLTAIGNPGIFGPETT